MSSTDQFLISVQVYQEAQSALRPPEETAVFLDPDPFQELPLASGPLLLGLRRDGHPLTLDLYNSSTGALLVAGDPGSGKTTLLRAMADASASLLDVQFVALTPFPEEWRLQEAAPGCLGVWPMYHPYAADLLERFVSFSQVLPLTRQVILLFLDGLDMMRLDPPVVKNLRQLLENASTSRILPVVTRDTRQPGQLESLFGYFHNRILGRTVQVPASLLLEGNQPGDLAALQPGREFYWQDGQENTLFILEP